MLVQRILDMGAEQKNPDPAEGYEERAEQGDHDQCGDFVDPVEHALTTLRSGRTLPARRVQGAASMKRTGHCCPVP